MTSAKIDVGYPVFDAAFLSEDRLVIAGGGGEGKNGIKNKIVCFFCYAQLYKNTFTYYH